MCTALMSLHAFTHCDTTSAFKGVGKVRPIRLLQKTEAFQETLSTLGDTWEVSARLEDDLARKHCTNISDVPTTKLASGKLLIHPNHRYHRQLVDMGGHQMTANSYLCGSRGHYFLVRLL